MLSSKLEKTAANCLVTRVLYVRLNKMWLNLAATLMRYKDTTGGCAEGGLTLTVVNRTGGKSLSSG
jgi:hypothetical protein